MITKNNRIYLLLGIAACILIITHIFHTIQVQCDFLWYITCFINDQICLVVCKYTLHAIIHWVYVHYQLFFWLQGCYMGDNPLYCLYLCVRTVNMWTILVMNTNLDHVTDRLPYLTNVCMSGVTSVDFVRGEAYNNNFV